MNNKTDDTQYYPPHNPYFGMSEAQLEYWKREKKKIEQLQRERDEWVERHNAITKTAADISKENEQLKRERDKYKEMWLADEYEANQEVISLRAAIEGAIDLINRAFAQSFHKRMFAAINEAKDKLSEALGAGGGGE